MISAAPTIQVDDINISEELIGRLHRATEDSVLQLVANLRANQRATCIRPASQSRALAI
jgi:hypothetical protein